MDDNKKRCWWAPIENEKYVHYHDYEWGVPVLDDQKLFEMLILEGAQAGLSWNTILQKRDNYQKVYNLFIIEKVAKYDDAKINELLSNAGIVRNKRKITSSIKNAQVVLDIQNDFGSFSNYLWNYVDNIPITNHFEKPKDVPTETALSKIISKDLKKRGMNFVGPTIIYSFMQAIGMVNDHLITCFRHAECKKHSEQLR